MNKIGERSPYLQIALGAGGGFITGYVLLKTCRGLAIVMGGTILIVELALQSGIITFSWGGYIQFMEAPDESPTERQGPESRALPFDPFRKIKKAILSSARFSVAFLGGFLLGMGFS